MSSSHSPAAAAAEVIQRWYREQKQRLRAHRLLLWLHLLHLEHVREEAQRATAASAVTPLSSPSRPSSLSTGVSHVHASDAAVLSQLLSAAVRYEAFVCAENFTRALLLEELLETSTTVRAASAAARRRLQQQHTALRRLSLSTELALRAREEACAALNEKKGLAVDVLRAVEAYLSPTHFNWWRQTVEASATCNMPPPSSSSSLNSAHRHSAVRRGKGDAQRIDAAASPSCDERTRPVPLQTTREDEEAVTEQTEEALDALVDALNEYERKEVETQQPVDTSTQAHAVTRTRVPVDHSTDASCCVSDAQLDSMSCVVRPVLGSNVGVQWRATSVEDAHREPLMVCAVCELDGVVVREEAKQAEDSACIDVGDRLVACRTCGTLIHDYCAVTTEAEGQLSYFCCCHCRSV